MMDVYDEYTGVKAGMWEHLKKLMKCPDKLYVISNPEPYNFFKEQYMKDRRAIDGFPVWQAIRARSNTGNPCSTYVLKCANVQLKGEGEPRMRTVVWYKKYPFKNTIDMRGATWVWDDDESILLASTSAIRFVPLPGWTALRPIPTGTAKGAFLDNVLAHPHGKRFELRVKGQGIVAHMDEKTAALLELGIWFRQLNENHDLECDLPSEGEKWPRIITIYLEGKDPILNAVAVLEDLK